MGRTGQKQNLLGTAVVQEEAASLAEDTSHVLILSMPSTFYFYLSLKVACASFVLPVSKASGLFSHRAVDLGDRWMRIGEELHFSLGLGHFRSGCRFFCGLLGRLGLGVGFLGCLSDGGGKSG